MNIRDRDLFLFIFIAPFAYVDIVAHGVDTQFCFGLNDVCRKPHFISLY